MHPNRDKGGVIRDPIEVHLIIERSAALKDNAEMWVNWLGKQKQKDVG